MSVAEWGLWIFVICLSVAVTMLFTAVKSIGDNLGRIADALEEREREP
jgi:hypothetical protein